MLVPDQLFKLFEHDGVILTRLGVDGEHAGRLADTDDLLARQLPMDVPFQRGLETDAGDVLFAVEDGLVQMRDRPAGRNMIAEQRGEFFRGGGSVVVAPGAERNEKFPRLVKHHVSVHHGREADRADGL